MNTPLPLTVVVPSYQRGDKIDATLCSIVSQDPAPNEIIVVNDGGWELTSRFVQDQFPQVRIVNVAHGGAALARNRGAELANNDVLVFLDDDDTLRPGALDVLWQTLNTFTEANAAFADHTYTNHITGEYRANHHYDVAAFSRLAAVKPLATCHGIRLFGRALQLAMLRGNLLQQPWIVRREMFLSLGGFCSGLGSADDWDLYLRLLRTTPIALTDIVVGNHFVEKDRPHLTLAPAQAQGQMNATRRQIEFTASTDVLAIVILRKKMALFHKSLGDSSRPVSAVDAWREYARSFAYWPLDPVVVIRLCLWTVPTLVRQLVGTLTRSPTKRRPLSRSAE